MSPQTIDEVLMELDQIILRARNERDVPRRPGEGRAFADRKGKR